MKENKFIHFALTELKGMQVKGIGEKKVYFLRGDWDEPLEFEGGFFKLNYSLQFIEI